MEMIGNVFDKYQIIQKIGGGNTGVVYKAFDPLNHRFLALKVLPNDFLISKEKKARFMREIKAASILSHRAIARLYEVGEVDGNYYIAMEYVDGHSYSQIIRSFADGLDLERFKRLMIPILAGVAYAHKNRLIHRDLKPDNLKMTAKGQPKVLDFGLVKFMGKSQGNQSFETMAGMVLGSAGYMSPEQAQGGAVTTSTDVFSLGVIMYELLTGKNPFRGKNPFETIMKIVNTKPLSIELIRPDLPMDLCSLVCKCLDRDANSRFPDAIQLYKAAATLKGPS